MNTQELLNKIKDLCILCVGTKEYIELESVLNLVNQLDQQQKPVVKPYVAKWYEENKKGLEYSIWSFIFNWDKQEESEFKTWMNYAINKSIETLIDMQKFGYEIEKVPKYTVRMKTLGKYSYLTYYKASDNWNFNEEIQTPTVWSHHTCEELEKAGFSWVFNCEGMEVKEVM